MEVGNVVEWMTEHELLVWWLAVSSVAMFVGTLLVVPYIIIKLPADYFASGRRHHTDWGERHPAVRLSILVIKNVFGILLVLGGIAMLVLPGQGVLTIVVGVMFLNFPGKYRLERWMVTRPPVIKSINWLRHRWNQPAMKLDDHPVPDL